MTDTENAKLRSTLKAIVVGTNAELCTYRDAPQCRECSMHRNDGECAVTDAMELLGCDVYGEPMEVDDTCSADETETWECVCDQLGSYGKRLTVHVMECSKCGHTYEHVNGGYEFCPRCGTRCVE